jgi:hypothetical protein
MPTQRNATERAGNHWHVDVCWVLGLAAEAKRLWSVAKHEQDQSLSKDDPFKTLKELMLQEIIEPEEDSEDDDIEERSDGAPLLLASQSSQTPLRSELQRRQG